MLKPHKKTEAGRPLVLAVQMHLSYIRLLFLPLSYRQPQELWKSTDNVLFFFNNFIGFLKL